MSRRQDRNTYRDPRGAGSQTGGTRTVDGIMTPRSGQKVIFDPWIRDVRDLSSTGPGRKPPGRKLERHDAVCPTGASERHSWTAFMVHHEASHQ
jgi:hypothetical protein